MPRPVVSFIMPVWEDNRMAASLVKGFPLQPDSAEWIVAAVDPSEELVQLARRGKMRLVRCAHPSRGAQMNAGAAVARGSLLCFHHADSEFRRKHLKALLEIAGNKDITGGAFHRHFDKRRPWMRRWEPLLRFLNSAAGPLLGDQSIFVKAWIFQKMGGFADIPLMEDLEFSGRLRSLGKVVLLDPPLTSSGLRFNGMGSRHALVLNGLFAALFYMGLNPAILHHWYYRARLKAPSRPRRKKSAKRKRLH
ncbi:MAG: glycosyltransferase [Methylacidiphilales bacterium]|nr:glycosyltransferase [Candidatus Methylacidiphilales bacterium]